VTGVGSCLMLFRSAAVQNLRPEHGWGIFGACMATVRQMYPFSAIVGQERLKRALVLNAVNPQIGGVLIRGEKGTAKSTAVRSLARLLPLIEVVAGDPYNSSPHNPALMSDAVRARFEVGEDLEIVQRPTPLVELPVAASEDRVVGSLDLEHAISEGQRRFEPGLLAQANRGLLYVDEVNLLDDHLVDVLLDAAAMGVNTVEREGISVSHPARFILVGTMNPEEGELRPQLLDRFGLVVEVGGVTTVSGRIAVIERRMSFDRDPAAFTLEWHAEDQKIAQQIFAARALLPAVSIARSDMAAVAALVIDLGVDGHRADLAILETARTHAAWAGRNHVTIEDIRVAAELALPHRMRRQPFTEVKLDEGRITAVLERAAAEEAAEQAHGESVKKNRM
jgi:Mg-chelatase subunit ChlI